LCDVPLPRFCARSSGTTGKQEQEGRHSPVDHGNGGERSAKQGRPNTSSRQKSENLLPKKRTETSVLFEQGEQMKVTCFRSGERRLTANESQRKRGSDWGGMEGIKNKRPHSAKCIGGTGKASECPQPSRAGCDS